MPIFKAERLIVEPNPMPGIPSSNEQPKELQDPTSHGRSCLFITAHVSRRLRERFGIDRLRQTPFSIDTLYCEPDNVDRPIWALRVSGSSGSGYIIGRWEKAKSSAFHHWYVGTTAITEQQFQNSHLRIKRTVKVRVERIVTEITVMKRHRKLFA